MGHSYQEEFTIPSDMVDVTGRAKLTKLLLHCLFVSETQALMLGASDAYFLEEYGLVWIVTDYEIDVYRLPSLRENIRIETEVLSYNKIFCQRVFRLFDKENQLLLEFSVYLALMDFKTRKVSLILPEIGDLFGSTFVKTIRRSPKMLPLEKAEQQSYQVRYSDIDMNGHVNNSIYLDWAFEALGYDFLRTHQPKKIQFKYSLEVAPGGRVTSGFVREDLTTYHEISSNDQINAQAIISWVPVED